MRACSKQQMLFLQLHLDADAIEDLQFRAHDHDRGGVDRHFYPEIRNSPG